MYNIDFKVSGKFVSIPVCLNDTLYSLITRMKDIEPFQKYSKEDLETKLIKCLNKVTNNPDTQLKIKNKIKQLISNVNSHSKNQVKNNMTFVNILQQSSINTSNFSILPTSQQRLKRNYLNQSNNLYDNRQNCEQLIERKLLYKYQTKQTRQTKQSKNIDLKSKAYEKVKINDFVSQYENYENHKPKNLQINRNFQRNITNNDMFNINTKYQRKDQEKINNYRRQQLSSISNTLKKAGYNPVPRLNELIQKSRSLSQIIQRDHIPSMRPVSNQRTQEVTNQRANKFSSQQQVANKRTQHVTNQRAQYITDERPPKTSINQRNEQSNMNQRAGKICRIQPNKSQTKYSYL